MTPDQERTEWIVEKIRAMCARYPRRTAGSADDRACTGAMAEELRRWADTVDTEPFQLSPHAFLASIPLQVLLILAAVVLLWLSQLLPCTACAWAALPCTIVALLSWVGEYVLYYPIFDRLYPQAKAQNVAAVRRAAGKTKKRIILTAHEDAAFEMPFFLHGKAITLILAMWFADSGMILSLLCGILAVLGCFGGAFRTVMAAYSVLTVIAAAWFLNFTRWSIVSQGANDNLTGCCTLLALMRELSEENVRFVDTEVICLITSGEESGLRGASAYVKAHRGELAETDTVVIAVDTLREKEQLMVYPRGINWTQKNSARVCTLLKEAGLRCGIDLPDAGFYPGGTDAEAFSRAGVEAAALCGLSHDPSPYYHTRNDRPDSLKPDCIEAGYAIVREAIRIFAEE